MDTKDEAIRKEIAELDETLRVLEIKDKSFKLTLLTYYIIMLCYVLAINFKIVTNPTVGEVSDTVAKLLSIGQTTALLLTFILSLIWVVFLIWIIKYVIYKWMLRKG